MGLVLTALTLIGFEGLGELVEMLSGLDALDGEILGELVSEGLRQALELAGLVIVTLTSVAGCPAEAGSWVVADLPATTLKIGVIVALVVIVWIRGRRSGRR